MSALGFWLVLVFAVALGGATDPAGVMVRGETTCPTPAQVSAALVGLLTPSPPGGGAPDLVEVTNHGATVSVRLSNAAHEVVGEKVLPGALSCGERAQTAAVIVASWEAHLRAVAGPLVVPPATAPPPLPPPPPAAGAPPLVTATAIPRVVGVVEVEIGAALLASIVAGSVSPAALIESSLGRGDSPFALGIGALVVGSHTTIVSPGRGSWRRFGGVVDLQSNARWRAVELQLHGGLALTALDITGEGLPVTAGAVIFDPGVLAGLRLRWRAGRLVPWVEATAASWPRAHSLYVNGSAASTPLPSSEALLGGGLSLAIP